MKLFSLSRCFLIFGLISTASAETTECEFYSYFTTPGCSEAYVGGGGYGGDYTHVYRITKSSSTLLDLSKHYNNYACHYLSMPAASELDYKAHGNCTNYYITSGNVDVSYQIRRHTSTTALSDATADTIITNANSVLQTKDSSSDIGCKVEISRAGSVTTFSAGDGSIDNSTEWNALSSGINVVSAINWCGSLGPNIIGCGTTPGDRIAVVRFANENILWAHEIGHNLGLPHRTSGAAIMNATLNSSRVEVNQTECLAFREG